MSNAPNPLEPSPATRNLSLWRSFNAVAWGFFGVRGNSGLQEDGGRLNPFYVIGAGIVSALFFVLFLMVLVNWIVKT
ncbi:MAG: DUF2970 domain-containing protein [Burkholderiales bacterium]